MKVRRIDPARSRILLVGVDAYTDASIPDEPAVANNITDLTEVLTDPALGAFDPGHLLVAPAGAGVEEVGNLLLAAAAEAEDLLLFYYAGHGFPTPRRAELHLSLTGTRIDRLAFTSLPFDAVRDAFLDSRAGSRVVILDCCYSGRAIGRTLGEADVLAQLDVAGTYTLTASPATRPASAALPGERHTAFTGRLLELLRSGDPEAGPDLSLGDIYRHLRSRLRADGLPEPQQRGTATGDQLALTPNPAYRKPVPPRVQPAPLPKDLRVALASRYPGIRAAAISVLVDWLDDSDSRLVLAARQELQKIAESDRPDVADLARAALHRGPGARPVTDVPVARVPAVPAALDVPVLAVPDLTTDTAELLARQISAAPSRAETLAAVAKAVAATDPRRAARLVDEAAMVARTVRDEPTQAELLVMIAEAVSASDPGRSAGMISEAQAIVRAILDGQSKGWAMAAVAEAVAVNEPNRAVAIARMVADPSSKVSALVRVAAVIGANAPGRAARLLGEAKAIAHESVEESVKVQALATVATAIAAGDPERARRLIGEAETVAGAMGDASARGSALAEIAQAAAASDPERAEAIARSISTRSQAWALTMVAEAVAASDPDRAGAIAHSIPDAALKARALATFAAALAASDPDEAETVAHTIAEESWKARALAMVAEAVAAGDRDRAARLVADAERIGHAINASSSKAWVLTEIAMARLRLAS